MTLYHINLTGLGLLSLGNFYLANTTGGYFERQAEEIPFLHTWSLSVEEQFYILWPALLLLIVVKCSHKNNIRLLTGLLIISALFSEYLVRVNASSAYFLIPARFFELLCGGWLAFCRTSLPKLNRQTAETASVLGLMLVFYSGLNLSQDAPFPGIYAFPVCLGTMLLISSGYHSTFVTRVISHSTLTLVGKISYSLYLWHWPIFAFVRYSIGSLEGYALYGAIGLSFIVSYCSYRWVETPFRFRWRYPLSITFRYMYIAPTIILLMLAYILNKGDGFIGRFNHNPEAAMALQSLPQSYESDCLHTDKKTCADILLIGDSHAEHFGGFVEYLAKSEGLTMQSKITLGYCLPLLDMTPVEIKNGATKILTHCHENNSQTFENINKFKTVILAGFWAAPDVKRDSIFYTQDTSFKPSLSDSYETLRQQLYVTLQFIIERNVQPIIIQDSPAIERSVFYCSQKSMLSSFDEDCKTNIDIIRQQQRIPEGIFEDIKRDFPQVTFIDPKNIICDASSCYASLAGVPLYRDRNHLNGQGSILLAKHYEEYIGNPFSMNMVRNNFGIVPR